MVQLAQPGNGDNGKAAAGCPCCSVLCSESLQLGADIISTSAYSSPALPLCTVCHVSWLRSSER